MFFQRVGCRSKVRFGKQVNRFASVLVYLNDEVSTGTVNSPFAASRSSQNDEPRIVVCWFDVVGGEFEGGETSFPLTKECPDPPL